MTAAGPARFARRLALLAASLGLAVACARPVSIGTGAGPVFRVQVENSLAEDMIVSYNDGTGSALLGTVRANSSQRFDITAPANRTVSITAANANRTRSIGPYSVRLQDGSTPTVVLR